MDIAPRVPRRSPRKSPSAAAMCPRSFERRLDRGGRAGGGLRPIGPDEATRVLGDCVGVGWTDGWQFGVVIEEGDRPSAVVAVVHPWRFPTGVRVADIYTLAVQAQSLSGSDGAVTAGVEAVAKAAAALGYRRLIFGFSEVHARGLVQAGWTQPAGTFDGTTWCSDLWPEAMPPGCDETASNSQVRTGEPIVMSLGEGDRR